MTAATPGTGRLYGCALAAGQGSGAIPHARILAIAALLSWLLTEGLGAYMLATWIASGGARRRPASDVVPPWVIFGHAGLAFAGFVSWVTFTVTSYPAVGWIALGFLAPAIGLGISTVTLWTPYPARRAPAGGAGSGTGAGPISDEAISLALTDEALTSKLVDELLASMLEHQPEKRRRAWDLAPLVPAGHGVSAMATFLLAMLAAIAAI